ncbi:S8 family peptidase [Thalassotalea ponticola]|uniref:S8 family peptidase n=1 Tax=Thalassotalea ponticola TaxID=1523392 RepID=UPI0025B56C34|nr:S8 family peptidase [Thalassotalea ponticola]MDN3652698.1 S8 family peptidase [Thalassotalea ponticola]
MISFKHLRKTTKHYVAATVLVLMAGAVFAFSQYGNDKRFAYIVQGASKPTLIQAVESVGGEVLHKYTVIQAISALMTDQQVQQVRSSHPMIRLFNDGKVMLSSQNSAKQQGGQNVNAKRNTFVSTYTGAGALHQIGITGQGVGVAIIDTGIRSIKGIKENTRGARSVITHSVLADNNNKHDENGHGTHIASIITNSDYSFDENANRLPFYNGIAPDANLVVVKAFDEQGNSTYSHILKALDYVVTHKDEHNIKVLNLSFSASPQSFYWDDPINQAVSVAWSEGITVLASAGNSGPIPMSIGVPGNNPYVITVGAGADSGTPFDISDDVLAEFSSAGPTVAGFIKPEIIAPGSKIQGVMSENSYIKQQYPLADAGANYGTLSGTSQSTAITTGIVALMLQYDPTLSPDDVKCRLLATAIAGEDSEGQFTYSIFQQGAGMVNAERAVTSTAQGCANRGLDIHQTLSATSKYENFVGPARYNFETEEFYIEGLEAYTWDGAYTNGNLWPNKGIGTNGNLWPNKGIGTNGNLWPNKGIGTNGNLWPNKGIGTNGNLWPNKGIGTNSDWWSDETLSADGNLWPNKGIGTNGNLWPNKGIGTNDYWSEQLLKNSTVVNTWFVE